MDLRIIRTRKAIRRAFLELLEEKSINSITIKEISERAEIDRKTFYAHYNAVFNIVDEMEDEAVSLIKQEMSNVNILNFFSSPKDIETLLETLTENPAFYYVRVLCNHKNTSLLEKLFFSIRENAFLELKSKLDIDDATLRIAVDFGVSGLSGCYYQRIRSKKNPDDKSIVPTTQFCETISRLLVLGITGISGKTENQQCFQTQLQTDSEN